MPGLRLEKAVAKITQSIVNEKCINKIHAVLRRWWMWVAKPTSHWFDLQRLFWSRNCKHHAASCKRERRRGPTSPVCAPRQKHDRTTNPRSEDLPSAALMSHCLYDCFFFSSGDHFQTCWRDASLIIPPRRKRLKVHSHTWIDRGIHLPPKRAPSSQFLIRPLQLLRCPIRCHGSAQDLLQTIFFFPPAARPTERSVCLSQNRDALMLMYLWISEGFYDF